MESYKVDNFLIANARFFQSSMIPALRNSLLKLDAGKEAVLYSVEMKDPTTIFVVSVCLGGIGIDRFLLGDIGLGILKAITGGGCFIWYLVDVFTMIETTKKRNYENLIKALMIY